MSSNLIVDYCRTPDVTSFDNNKKPPPILKRKKFSFERDDLADVVREINFSLGESAFTALINDNNMKMQKITI